MIHTSVTVGEREECLLLQGREGRRGREGGDGEGGRGRRRRGGTGEREKKMVR